MTFRNFVLILVGLAFLVGVLFTAAIVSGGQMGNVITTSSLLDLFSASVGAAAVFVLLRIRDRLVGVDFSRVIGGISHDPKAASLYYGLSVLGACILFGLILS